MNIDCDTTCKYRDDSGGENCGAPDPAEMCRAACPYIDLRFLPKPERMELLRLMNEEIKKTAYVSGLMRAMYFVNERKRMINGPDIPSHILDRQDELQRISERIESAINAVLQPNQ